MAETHHVGSLEIDEDLEFERSQSHVQHAVKFIFLLLLTAGLLGVFGGGPLSQMEATSGPLTLEYERFARLGTPNELRLQIAPATSSAVVPIWIDQAFLESVDGERLVPEPFEAATGEGRVVYRVALEDPSQPATITIEYQPATWGRQEIHLGVVDGAEFDVDQLVYP
jgi:hypothetical protein